MTGNTSKENQIKVLEKAIENLRNDKFYREGIQFFSHREQSFIDCEYCDRPFLFDFESHSFRVKPTKEDVDDLNYCKICDVRTIHKCDKCSQSTCDSCLIYFGSTTSKCEARCIDCYCN